MTREAHAPGQAPHNEGRNLGFPWPGKLFFSIILVPALAALYFAAAKLGLSMAIVAEQVSLVWPATGFALAVILCFGYRAWPAIALGAFLANATASEPIWTAGSIAVGNTLEAVIGAWLLRRAGFDDSLSRVGDVVRLIVLAAGVSTAICATIGVTSLCLGGVVSWEDFKSLWSVWWLGDAMGDLIAAPFLLTWAAQRTSWPLRRWPEALVLLAGLIATSIVVFSDQWIQHLPGHPLAFAVFPFAIWAALRFGQPATALAIAIASSMAIWGTLWAAPSAGIESAHERLLVLELFMAVIAVTALLLGAALAERRRALQQLQEQREWLHVILKSVGDAVIVANAEGRITFLNPVAQELTGWTQDPCGEELTRVFRIINEVTREALDSPSTQVARGGGVKTKQTILIRKDGVEIPIDANSAPIRAGEQNATEGVVVVFRDISERRQEERRKDEFLAMLAHELRNPLAPISNSLALLRLTNGLSPVVEQTREIIERQVNHMVRLVDDLLEVSRITRGKIELRKEPVDLVSFLRSAVETSRPVVEAAGHQFMVTLSDESMTVEADPMRLAQVVANLLNNAAKYTERGGKIWLTTRREGGSALISILDTGVGIAPDMLSRVFEMFAQADSTPKRAKGGLGIGLTLAKSLVQMHGGQIEAKSAGLGRGSEFIVRLPLASPAAPLPDSAAASPTKSSRTPLPARKVLIVDDVQAVLVTLGKLLEAMGQKVRTAVDATSALQCVQNERPDIVISDIAMPNVDGYELARRLRQEPGMQDVVLVALTGYGQNSDKQQAIEAGFDHHLVKPVSFETLEKLLSSLVEPVGAKPARGVAQPATRREGTIQ